MPGMGTFGYFEDPSGTAVGLMGPSRSGGQGRSESVGVPPSEGQDETAAMRDAAIRLGVPASAIVLDPHGLDSFQT